jgi:glucose dehydrogenase
MLDGTLIWAAPTGDKIQSSPAVSGDLVVVGSDDGYIYGLERLTGKRLWRVKTGAAVTSTPAIVGDTVFAASSNGTVMAIHAADGDVAWEHDAGSKISFSSPAVDANTVVIGTDAGQLLALRADNGKERWTFEAKAEIRSSPIIVGGTVYAGSYDENLYGVDLKTGEAAWSTDRGAAVGSPVFANGTIYVSLNTGELLALRRE